MGGAAALAAASTTLEWNPGAREPGHAFVGWSYERLPATASCARRAVLRWLSLKAAASHASSPACAHAVCEKVVVRKTKVEADARGRLEVPSPAMRG